MTKSLIVSNQKDNLRIALLEEGRLMELHMEPADQQYAVGDLYLGQVKKLAPSLNASFVNVGYGKDAFLHYHDLGPQINSLNKFMKGVKSGRLKHEKLKGFVREKDTDKSGKIGDILKPKDTLLVQIAKEPISTKGPRITCEISLAGRYMVLTPFSDKISISTKIEDKAERKRLTTLIESIRPEGFGVIVRTVAEGKRVAELHADLNYLSNKWKLCIDNARKSTAPAKVLSEMDRASTILRDRFNDDFKEILVDDEDLAKEMQDYIEVIAPGRGGIVKNYSNPTIPLFEKAGVEKQIKQVFGKNVNISFAKGAYLVIEHTEALHVIDVNSGNITKRAGSQEDSAFAINKLAATEIARQLRLRDMGGIVVVDFIDMVDNKHRKELFEHLKTEMSKDRARHKILPPSRFGLIQITRQRVRPEIALKTKEENPNAEGKEVEAPILLVDKIELVLKNILETKSPKKLSLHTHAFIAAYLRQGFPSIQHKWFITHKKWIKIVSRDSYKYLQFNFLDEKNNSFYNESN